MSDEKQQEVKPDIDVTQKATPKKEKRKKRAKATRNAAEKAKKPLTLARVVSRVLRRFYKLAVWLMAFILCLIIVVQIAFWGALVWINSSSGQKFIQARLGDGLEGSGYRVQISNFSYLLLTQMSLGGITVYQGDEKMIEASSVYLDVDLFPLKDKKLFVDLDIGTLTVFKTENKPKASPPQQSAEIQAIEVAPMVMPDVYFKDIYIDDINIVSLVLQGEANDTYISPVIKAHIDLNDTQKIVANLEYKDQTAVNSFPRNIKMTGNYDVQNAVFSLTPVNISSAQYNVTAQAGGTLRKDQNISLNAKVTPKGRDDLSPLTLDLSVKNTVNPSLNIKAKSRYADKDVSVSSNVQTMGGDINAKNIRILLPDLTVSGNATYHGASSAVSGKVSGTLERLSAYREYVGADHTIKPLSFNVDFNVGEAGQRAKIQANTASYRNASLNVAVRDIALSALYENDIVTIERLSMKDKAEGTMNAGGAYNIKTQSVDFTAKIKDLNALKGDMLNGTMSANISLKGDPEGYALNGKISPNKIEVKLPEKFATSIPQLNIEKKQKAQKKPEHDMLSVIALDVIVDAPRQIFVRGWGLDAEFGGQLEIDGFANDPQFMGSFDVLRGRYSEFGKKFTLSKAQLLFGGSIPPYPKMDIVAETDAGDVTAQVLIGGSTTKPEITFASVPALPQDEVMARILFGESMERLTPFQAVQLTQTIQRFSGNGGGGFDPIGGFRAVTGLDDLTVETNEEGGATVGAGKYLTDNVYLEFETGSEPGSSKANIEVELSPTITLESEIGQDAQAGGGVFWEWDY